MQAAVEADVKYNGLELESVSLTKLDQTDIKLFNPENFFDAEGLTTLKKITREREQERNAIVRDNEVAIAQKDLEARQPTLTIEPPRARRSSPAARHRQQDRGDARRGGAGRADGPAERGEYRIHRNWRSPTSRPKPIRPATPARSKPSSR